MGILTRALEQRATLRVPSKWMLEAFGASKSNTGISVTAAKALTYTAVYACVRVLSETLAMLPWKVYERVKKGKEERPDHYLWPILHDQVNPDMTSFEYREFQMANLQLRGNAYAFVERMGNGKPLYLWPLRADQVRVELLEDGTLVYIWKEGEGRWSGSQIHHIHGLSTNGITGLSPIALMREAVGMGLAHEEYGARFFAQGANAGGVLRHKGELGTGAQKRLKRTFNQATEGLLKSHKTMILEEGMEWTKVGVDPKDAQFLEGRKFQVSEIARAFRVPPHLIGDLENATFTNIEHQGQEFVTYSMAPWAVRWEQATQRDLFLPSEGTRFFSEFLLSALLRGDSAARSAFYTAAIQGGWMSRNEVRALENLNTEEELDDFLVPMNMITTGGNVFAGTLPAGGEAAPDAGSTTPAGAEGLGVAADIQSTLLNGAQVSSMVQIVSSVAAGILPRNSGLKILQTAFGITTEEAGAIMANAGSGFAPPTGDAARDHVIRTLKDALGWTEEEAGQCLDEWRDHSQRAVKGAARLALRQKYSEQFEEVTAALVRAETRELQKNAKKFLAARRRSDFDEWLTGYYQDEFPAFAKKKLEPIYRAYAEEIGPLALAEIDGTELPEEFREIAADYAESHAGRYASSSNGQITGVLDQSDTLEHDPLEAIDTRLALWSETRPAREGKRNGSQAGEGMATALFAAAGFGLIWTTQGESCELCNSLAGTRVGGGSAFVSEGDTIAPPGVSPLHVSQPIRHAPLHDGCDCYTVPG